MNMLSSFTARSALVLSALASACGEDIAVLGNAYADAQVNEISGDVSLRAKDAGTTQNAVDDTVTKEVAPPPPDTARQPDVAVQDAATLPSEVSPATCEPLDQILSKGACAFDIATSDANVIDGINTMLKTIDDLLSTTFKGISPEINNNFPGNKILTFTSGKVGLRFTTGKEYYVAYLMDNGAYTKYIQWQMDKDAQLIDVMYLYDCGILEYKLQKKEDTIISSMQRNYYVYTPCTPAILPKCSTTGAVLTVGCTPSTQDTSLPTVTFTQLSKDTSKYAEAVALLAQYKDLMKKHGVDIYP